MVQNISESLDSQALEKVVYLKLKRLNSDIFENLKNEVIENISREFFLKEMKSPISLYKIWAECFDCFSELQEFTKADRDTWTSFIAYGIISERQLVRRLCHKNKRKVDATAKVVQIKTLSLKNIEFPQIQLVHTSSLKKCEG